MAPQIKLRYFNLRGRGEQLRWILEYAGAKYEDNRIEFAEWPAIKPTTLTGFVPQLEFDELVLGEVVAIADFLGRHFDLAGKDAKEASTCTMIACIMADLQTKGANTRYEKDPVVKKRMEDNLKDIHAPHFFKTLLQILTKNGGKHLVGEKMTYVDLQLACMLDMASDDPEKVKDLPQALHDFKNNVMESPAIKEWVKKRPPTPY